MLPVRVRLGREKCVRRVGNETTTKTLLLRTLLLARQPVGYDEYGRTVLPEPMYGKPGDGQGSEREFPVVPIRP